MAETPDASTDQNVEERIRDDLNEAMRARDQVRMDTLRMALTAFRNEEVARSRVAPTSTTTRSAPSSRASSPSRARTSVR